MPFIIGLTVNMVNGFREPFDQIHEAINFEAISEEQYEQLIQEAIGIVKGKSRSNKKFILLFITLGLITTAYIAVLHPIFFPPSFDYWPTYQHKLGWIAGIICMSFIFIILLPRTIWFILSTIFAIRYSIRRLDELHALMIRPLNPDNAGGLKPLGAYTLNLNKPMTLPIFWIVAYYFTLGSNILLWVALGAYMIVVVFGFITPLSSAHNAMLKAKQMEMKRIYNEFTKVYENHIEGISIKWKGPNYKAELEDTIQVGRVIQQLRDFYNVAKNMPMWPFNTEIIIKLASALGIPFILIILKTLTGLG